MRPRLHCTYIREFYCITSTTFLLFSLPISRQSNCRNWIIFSTQRGREILVKQAKHRDEDEDEEDEEEEEEEVEEEEVEEEEGFCKIKWRLLFPNCHFLSRQEREKEGSKEMQGICSQEEEERKSKSLCLKLGKGGKKEEETYCTQGERCATVEPWFILNILSNSMVD